MPTDHRGQHSCRVVISHPGRQHSYEAAVAAYEAGFLERFLTSVYFGAGAAKEAWLRWIPRGRRSQLEGWLRRRWHPLLPSDVVRTVPYFHAADRLVNGFSTRVLGMRIREPGWADRAFDRFVAPCIAAMPEVNVVHAFEGAGLHTLCSARKRGSRTVLDVSGAHEYSTQATREEGGAVDEEFMARINDRVRWERDQGDYLLVASDFVRRCLEEHGVEGRRIVKIPYGVDTKRFRPQSRSETAGHYQVLFVGGVYARKGAAYLLEAWKRVNIPNAELILVGGADEFGGRLLRRTEGSFRWVGNVSRWEVHGWFASSDVFVLPSLAEGSALVVYEAMASGLPVVVTPNTGSIARDGLDGYVVPVRHPDALAKAIMQLYEQPEIRARMGASGRRLIEEQYTWGHYHRRLQAAYAAMVDEQPVQEAVDRVSGVLVGDQGAGVS